MLPFITRTAVCLALAIASASASAAGEAGLYGPVAPKGSTFVRVYNAGNAEVSASVGNTSLNEIAALGSSDFSFMPQGDYTAKLGKASLPVRLASDHYYTIVNTPNGAPVLVEETPFRNKQKALVRVQNLSDQALSLKTADGKTEVVPSVNSRGTGEREINPVKVGLALYQGERKVSDVKPVTLERGEASVLYVTGQGSALSPVWVTRPASAR
jgi:alginate O-acetyltransferase complex protein AlgF